MEASKTTADDAEKDVGANSRSPWLSGTTSRRIDESHENDFFETVRRLESCFRELPRFGHGERAKEEPLRIGQAPELAFAPNTIDSIERTELGSVIVRQRFLGLFGPSGPLPLEWTQQLRDQIRNDGDVGLEAFLDIFHHRMAVYFYRAWADARSIVQRDRRDQDRFASYVDSLIALDVPNSAEPLPTPNETYHESNETRTPFDSAWVQDALRYFSGHLAGQHRHAEGFQSLLSTAFSTPVRVASFAASFLHLNDEDRTIIGKSNARSASSQQESGRVACLGRCAVLGRRVVDRTSTVLVKIGPLSRDRFSILFLLDAHRALCDLIHAYVGPLITCRVQLTLENGARPTMTLGREGRLGIDSWVGSRTPLGSVSDCHFNVNHQGA